MRITVKVLHGEECSPIVSEDTTVFELKQLVANELDMPPERQRLVYQGKALQDTLTLSQCGVTHGSKLFLHVKEAGVPGAVLTPRVTSTDAPTPAIPELQKELHVFLQRHFSSTDAALVSRQFTQDFQQLIGALSLDDIERIAHANLMKT